jgi:hypothetical protein
LFVVAQPLSDILKRFEKAVKIHLTVFASANYILVDDVVMGSCYVAVGHPLKLAEFLKLT